MFYLCRYVGSGSETDPYRPALFDAVPGCSAVDLRADSSVLAGRAVVHAPVAAVSDPGWVGLSDDPDDTADSIRVTLQNQLGLTLPSGVHLRRLLLRLLIELGRNDGSRFRPLLPTGQRYELNLAGGLLDSIPVVAGGAVVLDSFDRANSANLGTTWTQDQGTVAISSNQASATAVPAVAHHNSGLASTDHSVQADVSFGAGASPSVTARGTSDGQNFYMGRFFDGTGYQLFKRVSGTLTNIGSLGAAAGSPLAGLQTTVLGSTVTVLAGGVSKVTVTDTALTAGQFCGIREGGVTGTTWDNWQASDLSAGMQQPVMQRPAVVRAARW